MVLQVREGGLARLPLTRQRIVETALRYVDTHGLEALSMHKLGAALGVTGMSLYSHVADKEALLDGIVARMWEEVELAPGPDDGWQETVRMLVSSLREMARRHPHAAPLLIRRPCLPEPALRTSDTFLHRLRAAGVPSSLAIALLRTIISYGLGLALAEQSFLPSSPDPDEDEAGKLRRVGSLVPPGVDSGLFQVALVICGECNVADEFELGIELMIRGLEAQLAEAGPPASVGATGS
jgi:AcrR family transcriptional regulator